MLGKDYLKVEFILFMDTNVCLHGQMCTISTVHTETRVLKQLKVELQMAMSYHVSAGN